MRFGLLQLYNREGEWCSYVPIKPLVEPSSGDRTPHVEWIAKHMWVKPDGWMLHKSPYRGDFQLTIRHDDYNDEEFREAIGWYELGEPLVTGTKREILKVFRLYARML